MPNDDVRYLHNDDVRYLNNNDVRYLHNDDVRYLHNDDVRYLHNDDVRYLHNDVRYLHNDGVKFQVCFITTPLVSIAGHILHFSKVILGILITNEYFILMHMSNKMEGILFRLNSKYIIQYYWIVTFFDSVSTFTNNMWMISKWNIHLQCDSRWLNKEKRKMKYDQK